MKKFLVSAIAAAALGANAQAASVLGFEISPELGVAWGQMSQKGGVDSDSLGGFGRVWLGALDLVVAPQFKYDRNKYGDVSFGNTQYGLSAGYNIGLVIARLTPYVGANYSSFSKGFEDTVSYNAGLKLKFDLIPISLGVLYTYQAPKVLGTDKETTLQSVQALVGLHF